MRPSHKHDPPVADVDPIDTPARGEPCPAMSLSVVISPPRRETSYLRELLPYDLPDLTYGHFQTLHVLGLTRKMRGKPDVLEGATLVQFGGHSTTVGVPRSNR